MPQALNDLFGHFVLYLETVPNHDSKLLVMRLKKRNLITIMDVRYTN